MVQRLMLAAGFEQVRRFDPSTVPSYHEKSIPPSRRRPWHRRSRWAVC